MALTTLAVGSIVYPMRSHSVIKISTATLRELEYLKRVLGTRSIDETIRRLRVEARRQATRRVFGIDKGRISPFTAADRWEDRD